MIVTWWGVRGSLPVPGEGTVRYGGNTSCVSVQCGDRMLVIDAGTGIVPLGAALGADVRELLVLLTHRHLDHVQGLPFFAPLYGGAVQVGLLDLPVDDGYWTPLSLFDGVSVPIEPPGNRRVRRLEGDPVETLRTRGWSVERIALRHPGGATGYRVSHEGRSFVQMTDTELDEDPAYLARCAEFCRGADVLSHDAQYLASELPGCRGRGHSSVERACDLAVEAGVGTLVLFHHDPGRDDEALDHIRVMASERLRGAGIRCLVAREGLRVEL